MDQAASIHLTFNLRLSRAAGSERWRITVYDAQTGTTLRFASLTQLDAFLRIVTRSPTGVDAPAEPPDAET